MASPLYNNASLNRQRNQRFGATPSDPYIDVPEVSETSSTFQDTSVLPYQEDEGPSVDERLAGAKNFLAGPNAAEPDALDKKLAALRIPQGEHFDTEPITDIPRYITDALSGKWVGDQFAESGHPLVGAGVNMAMMGPNFLGTGLSGLRKLVRPGQDESRLGGALEAGLSAAGPVMAGLKAGASLVPSFAKKISEGVRGSKAMKAMPESWQKLAGGRKEVPYKAPTSKGNSYESPFHDEPQDLGPALSDLKAAISKQSPPRSSGYKAELKRAANARPTPNATAAFDKLAGNGQFGPAQEAWTNAQYGEDLLAPLDRLTRLSKRAKAYRAKASGE